MTQQELNGVRINAGIEQMGGKGVAQCVAAAALWYLGLPDCLFDGFL